MKAKFRTTVLQAGKTATGVKVPDEIVESFKAGKRPPVRITIKGYTYRNTIEYTANWLWMSPGEWHIRRMITKPLN